MTIRPSPRLLAHNCLCVSLPRTILSCYLLCQTNRMSKETNPTANLPYVLLLLNKLEDHEVIMAKFAILSHLHGTSSHQHDDDDNDVETSHASTQSPTTYLNSLGPLNYQNYEMPSPSE
ncbi:hypothetical protein Tco_0317882 [Tanacetum coccineum]